MSFLHKLSVYIFGLIFSTIIIGVVLMVVGIISIPQIYAESNLKPYAENYVAKTYGDHYNISKYSIDGVRYNVFQDYVYGVEYTFSDKNKNESDFVIYVGNDDGTNKTVTDKRYYARNEYLIEQCFSKYTRTQLKQNNLPTKCDVEVSNRSGSSFGNLPVRFYAASNPSRRTAQDHRQKNLLFGRKHTELLPELHLCNSIFIDLFLLFL